MLLSLKLSACCRFPCKLFCCWLLFLLLVLTFLPAYSTAAAAKMPSSLPNEVIRHVYKSVTHKQHSNIATNTRSFVNNNNNLVQASHIANPVNVIPSNGPGAVYFSFNLSHLLPRDRNESTRAVEVLLQNNQRAFGSKADGLRLWLVSRGSRLGRGLMWSSCELEATKQRPAKNNLKTAANNNSKKKQRWTILRTKHLSCFVDKVSSPVHAAANKGGIFVAALSIGQPLITARKARRVLFDTAVDQRRPLLYLASYYSPPSISAEPRLQQAEAVTSSSPAATVSTEYAIEFLLGRHFENIEERSLRQARALPSNDKRSSRLRSNNLPFDGFSVPNLCKRQSLISKVEDVGLQDHIIYPRHFDIGQCSGACVFPMTGEVSPRTHTVIQLLHHLAQPNQIPAPCCVPVSFKPVTVLVRKADNSLVPELYDDLIVESCGCR